MARKEKCSGCGVKLLVPPDAQTIQCAVCKSITRVRTGNNYHLVQAQDSINHAANLIKTFINTAMPHNNVPVGGYGFGGGHGNYGVSGHGYYPPQPPRPTSVSMLPSPFGKKRAVLCGVSYLGTDRLIKGSVNDIKCMEYFLVKKMGFPIDSILTLTEYENDPARRPTKRNVRMALKWLVQGCEAGESLVFHYSGHGSRQRDMDGDEVDGVDETLCPVDYETQGMMVDDEINATIVRPLPEGVTLHALIDACYSATVLDLPFLCRMNKEGYYIWQDHRNPSIYKGTSGGLAVCISACDDHQTSADTTAFSGDSTLTGAMTYSFIQAMQNEPGLTYGRLLNAMRFAIREARTGIRLKGPIASLLNKLLATDLSQEPQISSSENFDIYMKQVVL